MGYDSNKNLTKFHLDTINAPHPNGYVISNEYELEKSNDFWLISIDGLAKEKVFSFLKYGTENYNLKNILKT